MAEFEIDLVRAGSRFPFEQAVFYGPIYRELKGVNETGCGAFVYYFPDADDKFNIKRMGEEIGGVFMSRRVRRFLGSSIDFDITQNILNKIVKGKEVTDTQMDMVLGTMYHRLVQPIIDKHPNITVWQMPHHIMNENNGEFGIEMPLVQALDMYDYIRNKSFQINGHEEIARLRKEMAHIEGQNLGRNVRKFAKKMQEHNFTEGQLLEELI